MSAVAIAVLAASIGTALTVYGLLGAAKASRTSDVRFFFEGQLDTRGAGSVSYPSYRRLRERLPAGAAIAAFTPVPVRVPSEAEPAFWDAQLITPGYFALLGTPLTLGREFSCHIESALSCHEVILSAELWRARFGSDPGILGRTVTVEGQPFTVAGVGPAAPGPLSFAGSPDVWLPLADATELTGLSPDRGDVRWLYIVGRVQPGVLPAGAHSLSLSAIRLVRLLRIRSGVAQQVPAIALVCGALLVAAGSFGAGLLLRGARIRDLPLYLRALLYTLAGAAGAIGIQWVLARVFVRFLAGFRVPVAELDTHLNSTLLAAACLLAFVVMALTASLTRRSARGPAA
ncbi:MAG TPA: ABC transporter permease [Bryobacteraceae bacterium]|nr:ABC transporter permease [Bryobacteraceae bacterium]